LLAILAAFPSVASSDNDLGNDPTDPAARAPKNYKDPDIRALAEEREKIEAELARIKANPYLSDAMKTQMSAGISEHLGKLKSMIRREYDNERDANRIDRKIIKKEVKISRLVREIWTANVEYDSAKAMGIGFSDEKYASMAADQQRKVKQIRALGGQISNKERRYEKKTGQKYRDSTVNPVGPADVEVHPVTQPAVAAGEISDQQKMQLPGCWTRDTGLEGMSIVSHYNTGRSKLEPGSIPERQMLNAKFDRDGQALYQKLKARSEALGTPVRIGTVVATVHNSRVKYGKGMTSETLANARLNEAVRNLKTVMGLESGDLGTAFAPGSDENTVAREDAELDTGLSGAKAAEYKTRKIETLPESTDWNSVSEKVCLQDSFCGRALYMSKNLETDHSGAAVLDAKGKLDIAATRANLKACCSASFYDLAYKPSQYVELAIYPFKFDKKLPACVEQSNQLVDASKVVTKTTKGNDVENGSAVETQPATSEPATSAPIEKKPAPPGKGLRSVPLWE
jgi:hypothetical protein